MPGQFFTGFSILSFSLLVASSGFARSPWMMCSGLEDRTALSWVNEIDFGPNGYVLTYRLREGNRPPKVETFSVSKVDGGIELKSPNPYLILTARPDEQLFHIECRERPGTPIGRGCFAAHPNCFFPSTFAPRALQPSPRPPAFSRVRCEGDDMYANVAWSSEIYLGRDGTATVLHAENNKAISRVFSIPVQGRVGIGVPAHYDVLTFWNSTTGKVEVLDPKTLRPKNAAFDGVSCRRF